MRADDHLLEAPGTNLHATFLERVLGAEKDVTELAGRVVAEPVHAPRRHHRLLPGVAGKTHVAPGRSRVGREGSGGRLSLGRSGGVGFIGMSD